MLRGVLQGRNSPINSRILLQGHSAEHIHDMCGGDRRFDGGCLQIPALEGLQSSKPNLSVHHPTWMRHHVCRGRHYATLYIFFASLIFNGRLSGHATYFFLSLSLLFIYYYLSNPLKKIIKENHKKQKKTENKMRRWNIVSIRVRNPKTD